MANILVVDDSPGDRRLVAEYLKPDTELHVHYSSQGAQALEAIPRQQPDLVITDLMMPVMNGLELTEAIRARFPLVPVILMTGRGDEDVASHALRSGAASYVPKKLLAQELLHTVHRVLAVSTRERRAVRLMGCMVRSDRSFILDNDSTLFGPLITHLQEDLSRMGICDEADRTRVGVALEEALTNALCHGNLEIDPSLRENDSIAYCDALQSRRTQPPYCNRRIHVDVSLTREKAVFTIRDEGDGFDPTRLPDPTDPTNLERLSGRGVLLMRTFMDEVAYNPVGNTVTLVKLAKKQDTPTDTAPHG